MDYIIREMRPEEVTLLEEFLYEAIFIPEGEKAPDRSIIQLPELQVYIDEFGAKKDDNCLVAVVNNKIVGAVWTRIMNDYGHIGDDIPSLAISLCKEYRGNGIGTNLMYQMLKLLEEKGYSKTSLAVQKENYAVQMYQKVGYKIIDENEEEYIMVYNILGD